MLKNSMLEFLKATKVLKTKIFLKRFILRQFIQIVIIIYTFVK